MVFGTARGPAKTKNLHIFIVLTTKPKTYWRILLDFLLIFLPGFFTSSEMNKGQGSNIMFECRVDLGVVAVKVLMKEQTSN